MKGPIPKLHQTHNASAFHNFVSQIHPRTVPESVLRFTHTYGLGGMAFVLFILSALSGILLMLIYEPLPHRAYQSVLILKKIFCLPVLILEIVMPRLISRKKRKNFLKQPFRSTICFTRPKSIWQCFITTRGKRDFLAVRNL
jgi:hypothetical protein